MATRNKLEKIDFLKWISFEIWDLQKENQMGILKKKYNA